MYKIGRELEGKFKGLKTLFIKGSGKLEEIESILNEYPDIQQFYFGAFNQSKIESWDVVRKSICFGKVVTVEVSYNDVNAIPDDIWKNEAVHKVVTFFLGRRTYVNVTLKVEDKIGIYCYPCYIYNGYDGYKNDIEVTP